MQGLGELLVGGHILQSPGDAPLPLLVLLHDQAPDTGEEAIHTLHALHAPGLHLLQRAHEHFIEPQCIGAIFAHDVIRVHHVAAGLRHLLTVLAEDEALVHQTLERFRRADIAKVKEHLVPEAGVKQVKYGVLRTTDVEIDHSGRWLRVEG